MMSSTSGQIHTYAQRLLNPFRGVVNVIKYESAEAVTMDGVHWDIYVANDSLQAGLKGRAQISDIRYGCWSKAEGLKRGPLYPSDDFKRLEAQGHVVYAYLRTHHLDVPFAFTDFFEQWLVDAQKQPMALLHSVLTEEEARAEMSSKTPAHWRAGYAAEEQFHSSFSSKRNAAEVLNDWINRRAFGVEWVARLPDGSGLSLLDGHSMSASQFPDLFLEPDQHEPPYAQLISDYLGWQAPWLLLLDTLAPETRRVMETLARMRAAEMIKHHHLYPELIDPAQLKAAQVEMALRNRRPEHEEASHTSMSPFYIELNPASGEYN